MVKTPISLSGIFVLASALYGTAFWAMTTLDADSAWSRFEALDAGGAPGRAVGHGDQAIALRQQDGDTGADLQRMQKRTADAHYEGGDPVRAVALYKSVLASPLGSQLPEAERIEIERRIAEKSLEIGNPVDAAIIFAEFVDLAGDAAANRNIVLDDSPPKDLLKLVDEARDAFTDALPPVVATEIISGTDDERLIAASRLTELGGYYARSKEGQYAAAGLLATAYRTRFDTLGPDHPDTVQTAMLLAPVYESIGRISDAEKIYLDAFHAQERAKGPNNPDLSLYLRLLADIYHRQGRLTEAEALNVHMRTLFRDSFGARRYASNRDRTADINRPVSADFPLPKDYAPTDLVGAEKFGITLSKPAGTDEMKIRAALLGEDLSMPKSLSDLIGACQSEDERLSLRSGYRSYRTQAQLYARSSSGQVAVPGTSEHQLGLAADIDVNGRFMRSTDRAYQCFSERAWQYGFILSFPKENGYLEADDGFEPWHWRFVGPRTALLYREMGPMGHPQEFLSALPCYEERALAGLFRRAGDPDICLEQVMGQKLAQSDQTNGGQ